MIHFSLKAGLKQWGKKAIDLMKSDIRRLCLRNTFDPRHQSDLTDKEKSEALDFNMFLKMKRDGNIKGITFLRAETDSGTSSRRKMQFCQQWQQKQRY